MVVQSDCNHSERLSHDHSIDAKSVFDALIKECTRVDRIAAQPSAGNDALRHLLRTGKLVWDEETIRQSVGLCRSKAVSRLQLAANEGTVCPSRTSEEAVRTQLSLQKVGEGRVGGVVLLVAPVRTLCPLCRSGLHLGCSV